jgi:hypothetical protein
MTHGVEARLSERFVELGTDFGVPVLVLIRQGRVVRHANAPGVGAEGATDARILARARVALLKGQQRVDPVSGGHLFLMPISSVGGDPLGAIGMVIPQELHGQHQGVPEPWLNLLVRYLELWVRSVLGTEWDEHSEPLLEQAEGAAEQALTERLRAAGEWRNMSLEDGFTASLAPPEEPPVETLNGHARNVILPPPTLSAAEVAAESAGAPPPPLEQSPPPAPKAEPPRDEGVESHREPPHDASRAISFTAAPTPAEALSVEPPAEVSVPASAGVEAVAEVASPESGAADVVAPVAAAEPALMLPEEVPAILVGPPFQLLGANAAAALLLRPGDDEQRRMLCFQFLGLDQPCRPCVAAAAELAQETLAGRVELGDRAFRITASPLDDGSRTRFVESFELLPPLVPEEPLPAPPWPPQYADAPAVADPAAAPSRAPVDQALEAARPELAADPAATQAEGPAMPEEPPPPPAAEPMIVDAAGDSSSEAETAEPAEDPEPDPEPESAAHDWRESEPPATEEDEEAAAAPGSVLTRLLLPVAMVGFVAIAVATWLHFNPSATPSTPTEAEAVDAMEPVEVAADQGLAPESAAADGAEAAAEPAQPVAGGGAAEEPPARSAATDAVEPGDAGSSSRPPATAPVAAAAGAAAVVATPSEAAAEVAAELAIPFIDQAAYRVALEFIAHDDLAGAADAWDAMLESEPKSNSTLMLETNCEGWAAAENLRRFRDDRAAILKPIYVEGRKCFLLAYGSFPSEAAAAAAIAELPEPFRSRSKRPIIRSFNLLP